MIYTECPYCDEPQAFGWESGMQTGYFPSKCPKCEEVMWVEATSIGGQCRTHEDFKAEIMETGDEEEIERAKETAIVHSNVVYE